MRRTPGVSMHAALSGTQGESELAAARFKLLRRTQPLANELGKKSICSNVTLLFFVKLRLTQPVCLIGAIPNS